MHKVSKNITENQKRRGGGGRDFNKHKHLPKMAPVELPAAMSTMSIKSGNSVANRSAKIELITPDVEITIRKGMRSACTFYAHKHAQAQAHAPAQANAQTRAQTNLCSHTCSNTNNHPHAQPTNAPTHIHIHTLTHIK